MVTKLLTATALLLNSSCPITEDPIDLAKYCRNPPGAWNQTDFPYELDKETFSDLTQELDEDALKELTKQTQLFSDVMSSSIAPYSPNKSPLEKVDEQCFDMRDLERQTQSLMGRSRDTILRQTLVGDEKDLTIYGNKHKNIIKLAKMDKALDLPKIDVPIPMGVSSDQVKDFLIKVAPEVFVSWEKLGKAYENHFDATPFLKTDIATSLLKEIDTAILKAFEKAGTDEKTLLELNLPAELTSWLKEIKDKNNYLMVRSTGAEDSKETANAGGNASVAYVSPDTKEFCVALSTVVRSYFGSQSLQNRINAKQNPFLQALQLAVTSQELIGETIGGATKSGDIPTSLVLFSNEPLYIGDEEFRVTRISASYGHGEAVVGNLGIPTDTFLVLYSPSNPDQLYILPDIQEKSDRLAPMLDEKTGKVTLTKMKNPKHMVKNPSISTKKIAELFHLGILSESFFNDKATDMEIVIKNGIIYPVQARPVNRKPMLPTYIDHKAIKNLEKTPIENGLEAHTLVPGKASVVQVQDSKEILVAQSLEEAEKLYDKDSHKLVVVHQNEPANSHPVVNFSGLGVPCLFSPKEEKTTELIESITETKSLAVCMQSGVLHLWDKKIADIEKFTSKGFVVHPAKIGISLKTKTPIAVQNALESKDIDTAKDLMKQISSATAKQQGLESLNALKNSSFIQSYKKKTKDLQEVKQEQIIPIAKAARQLEEKIDQAFLEIEAVLKQKSSKRLESLFHDKVLQTLLFAKKQEALQVSQYSILEMEKSFKAADTIKAYQDKLTHKAHFSDIFLMADQSPNIELVPKWEKFLLDLESSTEQKSIPSKQISELKSMLKMLEKADILPQFMTMFFPTAIDTSCEKTVENLLNLVPKEDEKTIQTLLSHKSDIAKQKTNLEGFADPKSFDKSFSNLKKLVSIFTEEGSLDGLINLPNWEKASPVLKTITLQTLNELVDTYDLSIKSMKASSKFDSDLEKVKIFKDMLDPYLNLLEKITDKVTKDDIFPSNISPNGRSSPSVQLAIIRGILEGSNTSNLEQLRPSRGFSVAAAMFGSGALFRRHYPTRLEDVFTLIHQNNLAITGNLLNQLQTNETFSKILPKKLMDRIKAIDTSNERLLQRASCIGIEITEEKIKIPYNVPLRNHSGSLIFIYDKKTQQVTIQGKLLGEARDRWTIAKEAVEILDKVDLINLAMPVKTNSNEIIMTWNDEKNYLDVLSLYESLAEMSLTENPNQDPFLFLKLSSSVQVSKLLEKLYNNPNLLFLALRGLVLNEKELETAMQAAKIGIQSQDSWTQSRTLEFLQSLVIKDQGFEAAMQAAEIGIQSQDSWTQSRTLELLQSLVIKDQGFEAATQAAKIGIQSLSPWVQDTSLKLFQSLVKKDQGSEAAIQAAKIGIQSQDIGTQQTALKLFQSLFEKNQGFEPAIQAAQIAIQSQDFFTRGEALKLFKSLVEKDQAFEPAIQAAKIGIKSQDYSTRIETLKLFKSLVEKDQAFEPAIQAAGRAMQSQDNGTLQAGLKLFQYLVEKDQGFEPAIQAAQIGMQRLRTLKETLELFKSLVEKDQGFEAAIQVAKNGIQSQDLWVQKKSHEILQSLIGKVKSGINSETSSIRDQALELFEEIIRSDQGLEKIIQTAKANPSGSYDLFKLLFKYNLGFEEAIEIGSKGGLFDPYAWFLSYPRIAKSFF